MLHRVFLLGGYVARGPANCGQRFGLKCAFPSHRGNRILKNKMPAVLSRGHGAMVARLTPDQKVGSSNLSALIFATWHLPKTQATTTSHTTPPFAGDSPLVRMRAQSRFLLLLPVGGSALSGQRRVRTTPRNTRAHASYPMFGYPASLRRVSVAVLRGGAARSCTDRANVE